MNSRTSPFTTVVTGMMLAAVQADLAWGGNLNPPPGAVAPTMKTLSEIEPRTALSTANTPGDADSVFKISQPGSYYLTGAVTGVAGKHGIEISAGGVILDLMGFRLAGVPGSLDGVACTVGGVRSLTVRSGVIVGWGGTGIDLSGAPKGCIIEFVHAAENAQGGISSSYDAVVRSCTATGNGSFGFFVGRNSLLESCTAAENGGDGIRAAGIGGTIKSCASAYNGGVGIHADNAWNLVQCSVTWNGGAGIEALYENTISDCTSLANTGTGIQGGRLISNCTSSGNGGDGILVSGGGMAVGNMCRANTGAGIRVGCCTGDVRIEGNSVTGNATGIDVDHTGNLIVRNSAAGNTSNNYDIVAGNRYGPIVNITGSGTAAALGSSAVSTMTTTDPWANFSY